MLKTSLLRPIMPCQKEDGSSHLPRWIIASVMLVPLALALACFFPYPQGRSLFVIPALGLTLIGTTALLVCHGLHGCWATLRHARGFIVFSFAMIVLIAANIIVLHPNLATPGNIKAVITLALGFNVFLLTCLIASTAPDMAYKRITFCINFLLSVLAAQIIFSYLTGWGEIYYQNDGSRRAYGMAGDGFTMLLVFGCLWAILGKRWALGLIMGTALLMTGGRMGLLAAILCLLLCAPLMLGNSKKHLAKTAMLLMLAIASCIGILHTANYLRQNTVLAEIQPAKPSNTAIAPNNASFAALRAYNAELPTHLRLVNHYYYSAISTGAGRLIGLGAGLQMLQENPVAGVGYGNSNAVISHYAALDFFRLQDKIHITPDRLTSERLIANQTATIAAETGLPGLVLFIGMCATALWIAARSYLAILRQARPLSGQDTLVLTCSIWAMVLIVGNQTATWFLPASPNLLWLYICLGLCAAHLANKARA